MPWAWRMACKTASFINVCVTFPWGFLQASGGFLFVHMVDRKYQGINCWPHHPSVIALTRGLVGASVQTLQLPDSGSVILRLVPCTAFQKSPTRLSSTHPWWWLASYVTLYLQHSLSCLISPLFYHYFLLALVSFLYLNPGLWVCFWENPEPDNS